MTDITKMSGSKAENNEENVDNTPPDQHAKPPSRKFALQTPKSSTPQENNENVKGESLSEDRFFSAESSPTSSETDRSYSSAESCNECLNDHQEPQKQL